MRVCGIDIKANEIIVCILSLDRGLFEAPEIRQRRINVANADDPKQLRAFQQTVSKLMEDYKVDKIAIKARPQKGKFAGAASGFKLETALQLLDSHRAYLISAAVVKETQKYDPLPVDFKDTGLKAFQEQAFMAAYTQLVGPRYPPKPEAKAKDVEEKYDDDDDFEEDAEPATKPKFVRAEKTRKPAKATTKVEATAEISKAESKPEKSEKAESPWGQARAQSKPTGETKPAQTKKENPWKKKD